MAPESALTDLKLRAAATRSAPEAGGISIVERLEWERNLLVEWAREKDVAFEADSYLSRIEDSHGEHHVYFDRERERYFKITHGVDATSAGFALTVDTDFRIGKKTQRYIAVPWLREATPFEYLARAQLFNLIFREDIEIEGVIVEPGRQAIVLSQRFINGDAASTTQVADFMARRGFVLLPGVSLGRRNSPSYLRAEDAVAVFDTHGENFLVSGPEIIPIDALILRGSDDLLAYLAMSPAERAAEIGC